MDPGAPIDFTMDPQATLAMLRGRMLIPTWAVAVAVNVTVLAPTGTGHVTLFPGGFAVPATSTINFATGQTRANSAIAALSVTTKGREIRVRLFSAGGFPRTGEIAVNAPSPGIRQVELVEIVVDPLGGFVVRCS